MFQPLENREKLSKVVARQIEEVIITKGFVEGAKLPSEAELCEMFKVSRTSIREAIQTLAAQGYLTISKGKGIYVRNLTGENISNPLRNYLKQNLSQDYSLDVVHARQMIEPPIAYQAALKHTKSNIESLEQDIEALKTLKDDFSQLAEFDMRFHLDLAKASQNAIVPLLLKPIHDLMPNIKSAVYSKVSDAKESALIWHEKILKAVSKGDADGAYNAMKTHLKIAEDHIVKTMNGNKISKHKS